MISIVLIYLNMVLTADRYQFYAKWFQFYAKSFLIDIEILFFIVLIKKIYDTVLASWARSVIKFAAAFKHSFIVAVFILRSTQEYVA